MLIVRPRRRLGVAIGAGVVALLLVVALGLTSRVALEPPGPASFTAGATAAVLLFVATWFAYWTYGCWSLQYQLDRNALTIAWAGNRYRIPIKDVTRLVPGSQAAAPPGIGGLWWPGYRVGGEALSPGGLPETVLFFATGRDKSELTYVVTPARGYAISLPDPRSFAEELKLRAHLGPIEEAPQEARRWWPWELPAWHDPAVVILLALGLVLNGALFASLALAMPALPDIVPTHLTPTGLVDRAGAKTQLFVMPAAGLALLAANALVGTFLQRVERFAGYIILAGGLGVQALLWAAWLRLLA